MDANAQIPDQVAAAILANRRHFHELNEKARAQNLRGGFVTKPLELEAERQFWNISDDDQLDEFLSSDLLGALYGNESIDWSTMPAGYEPLLLVLEFERHCAFEGWTAVSNKGQNEMGQIVEAYRTLGLTEESAALEAVTAAYVALANDDHPDFQDILGTAYGSVPNKTREEEDRAPLIWAYVRSNSALFCARR